MTGLGYLRVSLPSEEGPAGVDGAMEIEDDLLHWLQCSHWYPYLELFQVEIDGRPGSAEA